MRLDMTGDVRPRDCLRMGLAALMCAGFLGACEHPQREHYQTADRTTPVDVTPADLGIPAMSSVGVKVLSGEASPGRFPAAICIARIVARTDAGGGSRHVRVADFSAHHKVFWNQLFDEQAEVREVIFLTTGGLDPRGYDRQAVLDAAKLRGAELCILYARIDSREADAEYIGALWDTRVMKPLLAMRSVGVLPADLAVELAAEKGEDEAPMDPSVREADFRAEQDFRRMARDAVWDIVEKDMGATGDEKNPWKGYVPPRDRPWQGLRDLWGG
ncbi:MAG TPA: hypothetical protein P5081_09190 [Phycisphaerae bacterium]|nr:hypothetical protein [Phycisphaerae bacterium]HRW53051.1 hypothetical protein [Phycisphaerae bacterium]